MTAQDAIKKHLAWCELNESVTFCIVYVPLPNRFNLLPGDNLLEFWRAMERIDRDAGVTCRATMLKPKRSIAVFELTWDERR